MSDPIKERFDRLKVIPTPRPDIRRALERGKKVRRRRMWELTAVTLGVLIVVAGTTGTYLSMRSTRGAGPGMIGSDGDTNAYTDETNRYEVDLPTDWFAFSPDRTGDPRPIGTFATFPVDDGPYGTPCGRDFEGLTSVEPDQAVITLAERIYSPESGGDIEQEFPSRPVEIGPDDGELFPYGNRFYKEGCPDTDNEWWQVRFRDQGRGFYVGVQLGSELSAAERAEVWAIIDSLEFEPRTGFPDDYDYERYEDEEAGYSVVYPKVWQRADESLTPYLDDPKELLAIGSFPIEYRPTDCAQLPKSAFKDMGPSDILVSVQERAASEPGAGTNGFPPRPRTFRGAKRFALECVPEDLIAYWIPFSDSGRLFYALAVFGPDAPPGIQDEAWGVLDSFTVEPSDGDVAKAFGKLSRSPIIVNTEFRLDRVEGSRGGFGDRFGTVHATYKGPDQHDSIEVHVFNSEESADVAWSQHLSDGEDAEVEPTTRQPKYKDQMCTRDGATVRCATRMYEAIIIGIAAGPDLDEVKFNAQGLLMAGVKNWLDARGLNLPQEQ